MLPVLALLIVGAWAQGQGGHDPIPDKCCTPHQFTALMAEVGEVFHAGIAVPVDGLQRLAYDYHHKLLAVGIHMKNMTTGLYADYAVLIDYNAMKTYTTLADGTCFIKTTDEPMVPPCIPDDARFLGTVFLGSGASTLKVHAWEFTMPGTNYVGKLMVTADNCTPVMEGLYGSANGDVTETTYVFTDFHAGIRNRSMLVVPTHCAPMPTVSPQDPVVGRRSLPFSWTMPSRLREQGP